MGLSQPQQDLASEYDDESFNKLDRGKGKGDNEKDACRRTHPHGNVSLGVLLGKCEGSSRQERGAEKEELSEHHLDWNVWVVIVAWVLVVVSVVAHSARISIEENDGGIDQS